MASYISTLSGSPTDQKPTRSDSLLFNVDLLIKDAKLSEPILSHSRVHHYRYSIQLWRGDSMISQTPDFGLNSRVFALSHRWCKPVLFRRLCDTFSNKAVALKLVKKDFTDQGTMTELIASREISISPQSVTFGELRKFTIEFPGKGFGFDRFIVNIELELAPKDLDKTLRPFETLPNKAHTCC
jgi:hypothetical protein